MNGTVILIGLIVLVIVVSFEGTQVNNFIQSNLAQAYQTYANTQTGNALQIHPKAGQTICSLKVVFTPFLRANGIIPPLIVQIDHGAMYSWYGCTNTNPTLNDFFPTLNPALYNFVAMDVFGLYNVPASGLKFDGTLVADDGTQVKPIVNPVPATGLNSNLSGVGQKFSITFVYQGIPKQHYKLNLSSIDIGINQAGTGNIYYQDVS